MRSIATLGPPPREAEASKPPDPKEIAAADPRKAPERKATKMAAAATSDAVPKPVPNQSACSSAASRSERIVCANGNLSSLDRQLSLLYRQSWNQADEKKKAALVGTRQRFNDRRDACGSSNCMTTAYVTRLREISDIMAGKGQQ